MTPKPGTAISPPLSGAGRPNQMHPLQRRYRVPVKLPTLAASACNLSARHASNEVPDRALAVGSIQTKTMSTTYPIRSAVAAAPSTETDVVRSIHATLKYLFSIVPIVAGADKFVDILTEWHRYL